MRLAAFSANRSRPALGGVVIGFLVIWATAFALPKLLGEQTPIRADGGLSATNNLLFFITLELLTGAIGGMVTTRMDSPSAAFRLAIAVVFVGGVVAYLASNTPNVPVSGGLILTRTLLQAAGVVIVAALAWRASLASKS